MASKRVVKSSVDWIEMSKRVPTVQKSNFIAFKAKSDGYIRKVAVNPEEPPKIDWSYYKANAANKAIVEQFEKQYNNTKIPYPSDKGAYAKIEEEEKVQMSNVREFIKNSNERIKKYEKDLEIIRNYTPYEEMTEEEFAYAHPELALDSLNKPTNFPHTPEVQPDAEDLEFFRKRGFFAKGPDRYFP